MSRPLHNVPSVTKITHETNKGAYGVNIFLNDNPDILMTEFSLGNTFTAFYLTDRSIKQKQTLKSRK